MLHFKVQNILDKCEHVLSLMNITQYMIQREE